MKKRQTWQLAAAALGVMALVLGFSPTNVAGAGASTLFADGFESGSTSAWSAGTGLVVGTAAVADGSYAARANMTGSAAYVHRNLATATTEATTSVKVNLASISGSSAVNFLKIRTASGTALAEVFITPSGVLGLRNDVTGVAVNSTKVVTTGTWHTITLRAVIAGTASTTEVTYDGATVAGLGSSTADLGTTPIGRVQIGENVAGRTADLSYDTVTVSGPGPDPTPTPTPTPSVFADGFESGSTSAWSAGTGLVVGTAAVADGSYAARANMTGSAAYVHRNLATATTEATTSVKVNLASISGTSAVNFLKIRTASGTALAEVFITPSGVLGLRNDVTGVAVNSTEGGDHWHLAHDHVACGDRRDGQHH